MRTVRGSGSHASRPRLLYVSSAIGLGHLSKDLAIAAELRRLSPDLEIGWLAGEPTADALRDAGERVLPEAARWRGATRVAERCLRDGRLDLVRYCYRSFPSWAVNALVFRRAVRRYRVAAAVGDEAWEVDIPLILRLLRPPLPFVLVTDFVGLDVPSGGILERLAAWPINLLWSLDRFVYDGRGRHAALFIGEPEDVPQTPLGRGLPDRRRHACQHYRFVGHVLRFDPRAPGDGDWRRRLGCGDGDSLVVAAAGGTSVGRELLELCGEAAAPLRARVPRARVVLVAGPRIPVGDLRVPAGVTVLGYVPRLYELFSACDAAVVQCGASSTTELAALGKPFVYVPIDGHFEQELVAARLMRHRVGRRAELRSATAASLAQLVAEELERGGVRAPLPVDGAERAARHILAVLRGEQERRHARHEGPAPTA